MTEEEVRRLFVLGQTTWPKFVREDAGPLAAQIKWWAGCLDDIAAEDAYEAIRSLAKTLKWPPKISEIRAESARIRRTRKYRLVEMTSEQREIILLEVADK